MTLRLAHNPRGAAVQRLQGMNNNRPLQIWNDDDQSPPKMPHAHLIAGTDLFVSKLSVQQSIPLEQVCGPPQKTANASASPAASATSAAPSTPFTPLTPPAQPHGATVSPALSDHATRLILSLVTQPFQANTPRCNALGMSAGVFSRSADELSRRGLILRIDWRRYRYLVFTDEGAKYITENHHLAAPLWPGKGDRKHKLAIQLLRLIWESRGCRVRVEAPVGAGGKLADMVIEYPKDGRKEALEYAGGTSTEAKNLQDDLAQGTVERVVFVFPDKPTLERWHKRFLARPELKPLLSRMDLELMANLLKELPQ